MVLTPAPTPEMLRVFETIPSSLLVLSPELIILTASNQYVANTRTSRDRIVGKHIFEAFPGNPEAPEVDGVGSIRHSLRRVLATGQFHQVKVIRYDVPHPTEVGQFIEEHWLPSHMPVLDEKGKIWYIIQQAINVTESVRA